MARGPGKYDDVCSYVREQAKAETVVLIVLKGNRGSGFSVQTKTSSVALSRLLRDVADDLDTIEGRAN